MTFQSLRKPPNWASKVAVVGGGVGGLSVSAYLRLAGFDVTLYEQRERVGGRANLIERDGYRFDTGPTLLNYPWVFEDFFQATGKSLRDYVRLKRVDPSIRFLWRDGQALSLSSDIARLRQEIEAIDRVSASHLMAFLSDAGEKYQLAFNKLVTRNEDNLFRWFFKLNLREMLRTSVWRSLDGELARFFPHERVRMALGAYAMYLGGSPWNLPGLFSILPYGELAHGLWLPEGGMYRMVQVIERRVRELGVRIETGRKVSRILVKSSAVEGLEFDDGVREKYPIIVSNVDVPTTQTQLLGRSPPCLKMTPGVITFYWALRKPMEELGHHTIFLPDNGRVTFDDLMKRKITSEDPAFYVNVASSTEPCLAPAGGATVFVLVPTPLISECPDRNWAETIRRVRERVLERLNHHNICISDDQFVFEVIWAPPDWQDAFGLYDGSAFGAAHTLFQVGPLRSPNYDRNIRGLYYVGASTTPGTGVPMVLLSGKMTAERILSHVC